MRDADVFLMDEPLSNLDARLRVHIRIGIAAFQARLDGFRLAMPGDLRHRRRGLNIWTDRDLLVGIRPESIALADDDQPNAIPAEVRDAEFISHEMILYSAVDSRDAEACRYTGSRTL